MGNFANNPRTLADFIDRHKFTVDTQTYLKFSKQLVNAGAYLESKNIVHRDIKPENIFLKGN